jgi:hypothetical protein
MPVLLRGFIITHYAYYHLHENIYFLKYLSQKIILSFQVCACKLLIVFEVCTQFLEPLHAMEKKYVFTYHEVLHVMKFNFFLKNYKIS